MGITVEEALTESVQILQEEIDRVRHSNRILRIVNSTLRNANESLRRQLSVAHHNDQLFKEFCEGNFTVGVEGHKGGLPVGPTS